MTSYRRAHIPGGTYFFTVNLLNRRSNILVDEIDRLRQAVRHVKQNKPFTIVAWVTLPDHLHAIWTLPERDSDYSSRWRAIKASFSNGLPDISTPSASRARKGERGIWQRRFWEHAIRDETDLDRHMDYVHFNPVKHGHVPRVADWPFSTFHRYVKEGYYPEDWGVAENGFSGEFGEAR